jgi:hypothetical protein
MRALNAPKADLALDEAPKRGALAVSSTKLLPLFWIQVKSS